MKELMSAKNQREQLRDEHDELIRERVELIRERVCQRYATQDAYTISELTRSYDREDSRGRIGLLRRVYRQTPCLPYELALRAVTDGDPAVREWMAREGQNLDYREAQYGNKGDNSEATESTFSVTYLHPDRNLVDRLRRDADPFVRAAFFENAEINAEILGSILPGQRWIDEFKGCSPLERLAMTRNEALDLELVKLILDPDDRELGIEMSERRQLANTCLVNKRVVENGRRTHSNPFLHVPARGPSGLFQSRDYSQAVWELAAKWPDLSGIPFLAFHAVQTYDRVKAKIYSTCKNDHLRSAILEGCLPEDEETLRLARADTDQWLRSAAYQRSRRMDKQEIEAALRREKAEKDNGAMDGLFTNPWLEPVAREILDAMAEG